MKKTKTYQISSWKVDNSVARRIAKDINPMIINSLYNFLINPYHTDKTATQKKITLRNQR
jgi:hypothetical protein